MNQEEFDIEYDRLALPPKRAWPRMRKKLKSCLVGEGIFSQICGFLPILDWLPKYEWKNNLFHDIIGGLTVGIMHVPQGMAYANLAGLDPVYGLYSSFFACFFYMFFGTSRHISIGVFAVASLMVGSVRLRLLPDIAEDQLIAGAFNETEMEFAIDPTMPPIVLTTALTLTVGAIQIIMGALHLDFLTAYMSDQLLGGFTTGAACHVFVAQLNKIIGVKLPRHSGLGMLIFMLRDLGKALPQTNIAALIVSICSIAFLVIGRDYINPRVKKRFPIPIPFELLLVIFGTAASFGLNLRENYGVKIVDHIPKGIPTPSLPRIDLVPILLSDSVGIAIVCYVASVSMGKLFAKRHRYRLDPGQELYALGFMECLSSFFPVYPAGTAISRSLVCEAAGTKTQLHIVFSTLLLLCVIQWVGPLLEALPMCVLACIVVVALQGIFMQYKQLKPLWTLSKFDFAVWIVSFLATACYEVMHGLAISVAFVLLTVVLRSQWAKWQQLGQLADSDEFRDLTRYGSAEQLVGVRILRFATQLNFTNVELFRRAVQTVTDDSAAKAKTNRNNDGRARLVVNKNDSGYGVDVRTANELTTRLAPTTKIDWLIIDCSGFAYLDAMGVEALKETFVDLKKQGINVFFAAVSDDIRDMLDNIGFHQIVPEANFFPSVKHGCESIQETRKSQ